MPDSHTSNADIMNHNDRAREAARGNDAFASNAAVAANTFSPNDSSTPRPESEITGTRTIIAYLEKVAAAQFGHGNDEGFLGSMHRMEVGAGDRQLVVEAQQMSKTAAAKWADAAAKVREHNLPLIEAYSVNPQAANKHGNTNE